MTAPKVLGTSWSHRPIVMAESGMVVAGHHRAAEAGASMLRAGGNAMDAAVATATTLAIAIPFMNGLGGDCFALHAGSSRHVTAINGSGAVARAASVDAYRSRGVDPMPVRGPLTVSVPGFVAAIGEAADRFATFPLAQLLEPAIALAENGVPVDASALAFFNGPLYSQLATDYPRLADTFGAPGSFALGDRLLQPAAASTLRTLARHGWRAFYEGSLADAWLSAARVQGVLLDSVDLAEHRTAFVDALSTPWRGRRVHAAPPNSQGLALLALLALDDAQPSPPPVDASDPLIDPLEFLLHKRRAFELRDACCADPRRVNVPKDIRALVSSPGELRETRSIARVGGGDTSTFVVIDREGQAVSWAQSLFEEFGSGVVCPDQGVVLHNRAALERLNDDPVHGLRGGFRPFHTLCPSLVTSDDGTIAAIATPGDHGQPQTLALVIRRHFEQGLDIQAAIEWPRLRHDAGSEVMLEDRCPLSWDRRLESAGFSVRRVGPWSRLMGGVNAIVRRPDGLLMAGADPRRSSYAICA